MNESRRTGILRLRHLHEVTEAVGEEMSEERKRFDALREAKPTKAISSFNLFQTPTAVADMMAERLAEMLGDLDGKRLCEPSAGLGRLVHAAGVYLDWTTVDISNECCEQLYDMGVKPINEDFLSCDAARLGGTFDGFLMNPPFKLGRDIKHIKHAMSLTNKGGAIVALCYNGVKQNKNLKPIVDTWEVLPENSFASEGTKASVAIITWRNK